jgi:hypothetical protein
MILVEEEEYRTRPEGPRVNDGIRESHVDVNYDIRTSQVQMLKEKC